MFYRLQHHDTKGQIRREIAEKEIDSQIAEQASIQIPPVNHMD
jgi:hypothetical protein